MFECEPYILAGRNVRSNFIQYIMYRTAVVIIAVMTADSSDRTVRLKGKYFLVMKMLIIIIVWTEIRNPFILQ